MRMREEFIYFPPGKQEGHFNVLLAGKSYCNESYIIKRDRSDCMVMEYVISGRGVIRQGNQSYEAKAGDIYVLPAGVEHLYFADKNDPWIKIWFNAAGTLTNSLLREYNPRDMVVFSDAGGKEYFDKIHEIGKTITISGAEKHRKAAVVFHELLQYLYDKFYGENCLYSKETFVIKEYLDEHVEQNISLKELAELVYLSESQVIRIFKRDVGKTPHEYCLERKLMQAENLLRNTHLMVREIAEYLGFCDEHYFSYIFKKKLGKTPLEYRKSG
jgi:AraC-like DNA-binding protein